MPHTASQHPDPPVHAAGSRVPIDHPLILRSPYTWKIIGAGESVTAEACMPGAYVRLRVSGTSAIQLEIDGTAHLGSSAELMPVIEYQVDAGPLQHLQLPLVSQRLLVPLAQGLDPASAHAVELMFRAGTLVDRWLTAKPRLRLAGFLLDASALVLPTTRRALNAIGWGDSITEGVGVDALFTSWAILEPNNARGTWFPIAASALGAEYGQLGTGGQSMGAHIHGGLPPLTETWSVYDSSGASRLREGRLDPAPDYIFCNMGTNDRTDPSAPYQEWLTQVRTAAPHAHILVVIPINGFWRAEITALVRQRQAAGDPQVHLIDCPELQPLAPAQGRPTALALDGVHPTLLGEALFGAAIAVQTARLTR
jgi:lysophospholipase L1-like esterase